MDLIIRPDTKEDGEIFNEDLIKALIKENKELKEKLDKIEKARIKYEDVFYKVTRQWDDSYGELDEIIMNR